jgi:hypothetical protein
MKTKKSSVCLVGKMFETSPLSWFIKDSKKEAIKLRNESSLTQDHRMFKLTMWPHKKPEKIKLSALKDDLKNVGKRSIFQDHKNYRSDCYDLTLTSILKKRIEDLKGSVKQSERDFAKPMIKRFKEFHYYLPKLGLLAAREMIIKRTAFKPILDYVNLYKNDGSYKIKFKKSKINHTSVCPEMGGKAPENVAITYKVAYGGKYYLTTDLNLKGRGIKQAGNGSDHARRKKTYFVTALAFKKLKKRYSTCYIEHLD